MGIILDILSALAGSDEDDEELQIGDIVEILSYGEEGEIVDIQGDEYYVEIDDGSGEVDTFEASDLKKI